MQAPDADPILGVDIGGTKTVVCLGTEDGVILERVQFPTDPARGPVPACDRIASEAESLLRGRSVREPVGISAPGPLSSAEGRFLNPPNMPGWHGFELVRELEARLRKRVVMMNDANAAGYAEWRFGAGRGTQTMIFLTMSTGLGAGLVIGGKLHEGLDDLAGEIGHTPLAPDGPVGFARRGSVEGFLSGPGMVQLCVTKLHQAVHRGERSSLLEGDRDFRLVDMPQIGDAARSGDAVALETFREVGERLGDLSAMLIDLLNPEAIVVGTIGRLFHDLILPSARARIDERCHARAARRVEIKPAELGPQTGDLAAIAASLAHGGTQLSRG